MAKQSYSPFPSGSPSNPKPVNASKAPKGTIFGAPNKAKVLPKRTKNRMMKQLSRNYS